MGKQYKEFLILPARKEDIEQGYIWIKNSEIEIRTLVKINNIESKKTIYCEALNADVYYLNGIKNKKIDEDNRPDTSIIFMNAWYRNQLKIIEHKRYFLLIEPIKKWPFTWFALYKYYCLHPNSAYRFATTISIVSLVVGLIGLLTGVFSTCSNNSYIQVNKDVFIQDTCAIKDIKKQLTIISNTNDSLNIENQKQLEEIKQLLKNNPIKNDKTE